jgi:geranylgeranyl diphosphate synthase, type II
MDIKEYLEGSRILINRFLESYFAVRCSPDRLLESMMYSIKAGGKRIRPILALASCEACGGNGKDILPQAAALELIHTYSLIHDDLPAMDNDDLRRGKPTNHKVFGEAMAILAGDALLTEAFLMLTYASGEAKSNRGGRLLLAVREIALAAGAGGMVGGQAEDIDSENVDGDRDTLEFIHQHKTSALITAAVRLGGILAGAGTRKMRALTEYGQSIGLSFQIVDDILDIEGTAAELGKNQGSDLTKHKMTYPSLYGIEGAKRRVGALTDSAIDALRIFSATADPLRGIAFYLHDRRT